LVQGTNNKEEESPIKSKVNGCVAMMTATTPKAPFDMIRLKEN